MGEGFSGAGDEREKPNYQQDWFGKAPRIFQTTKLIDQSLCADSADNPSAFGSANYYERGDAKKGCQA